MSVVTELLGLPDDADAATIKTAITALQTLSAYAKLNEPPVVHVDVHVPEQAPPVVNVTMPETQASPVQVDVHVPEQLAPTVNVTMPETQTTVEFERDPKTRLLTTAKVRKGAK